jgi:hypothetical protein
MEHTTVTTSAKAPAENFTGDVYVSIFKTPADVSRLVASLVRFTPGAPRLARRTELRAAPWCSRSAAWSCSC